MKDRSVSMEPFYYRSKNPMLVIDKDFSVKLFNPVFTNLFGFTQDDFINDFNFINLLHEEDKNSFYSFVADSYIKDVDLPFDLRIINNKGKSIWMSCVSLFNYEDRIYITLLEKEDYQRSEITEANHILNEIINRVPHPIFLKDHTGKYVLVNQSQSELFSMSSGDLLGKDDSNFIADPTEFQEIVESDLKVVNNKLVVDLPEQIITTPLGEKKFLYTTKVPLVSPIDGRTFILGVSIDLTTLKKYEDALKHSEEKYKSLVDISPDAIVIIENGRISFINDSGLSLLKANSASELIGRRFFNFIHEDYYSLIIKRHNQLREGKKLEPIEEKFIRLDGQVIDVEVSSIPFYYKNKFAIQVIARDITERVKARDALYKTKMEFQALAENSNDIIARFNSRYEILYINKTIIDYTNRFPEYFKDKNINELNYPQSFLKNVRRVIDFVFKTGKTESVYFSMPSVNGQQNCFATIVAERDNNEDIQSVLCTVRNINELKQKEKELISINKELNTFIYKASHDIKGPLATIMGLTNLSISGHSMSQDKEIFKLINKTALDLNSTLKRLLEIVKIKEDPLILESIEVTELIKTIADEYKAQRITGDVDFSLMHQQTFMIKSDRIIFSSIIRNILNNSVQYKSDNVLQVEIFMQSYKDGIMLSIKDNGVGIEEAVQDKIFDMFYRGNINSKGSGLGLYMVKNALKKLKGTISVKSQSGKGTEFIIYIPSFSYRKRV